METRVRASMFPGEFSPWPGHSSRPELPTGAILKQDRQGWGLRAAARCGVRFRNAFRARVPLPKGFRLYSDGSEEFGARDDRI